MILSKPPHPTPTETTPTKSSTDSSLADNYKKFFKLIPKADLHIHFGGTLQPQLMWDIAKRNNVELPFKSVEAIKNAYKFKGLSDLVKMDALTVPIYKTEQDFYDVTWALCQELHKNNVVHFEIQWGPSEWQQKTNISYITQLKGISEALKKASKDFGMTGYLLPIIMKQMDNKTATKLVQDTIKYKNEYIVGIGSSGPELGFTLGRFEEDYKLARENGLKTTAHAGEEGGPDYIWYAINIQKVDRVDHGVQASKDEKLMNALKDRNIPVTICPVSNIKQNVFRTYKEIPIKKFFDKGINVSVNTDDPGQLSTDILDNYMQIQNADMGFNVDDYVEIAKMSFRSSFQLDKEKNKRIKQVDDFVSKNSGLIEAIKAQEKKENNISISSY